MTRTDRHRPSAAEFDPEDYAFTGVVYDAQADWPQSNNEFRAVREQLLAEGFTFSGVHGGTGQCDHCGSLLRYSALMVHTPTRTLIYVGEQCLDNRFNGMTKGEFDKARKAAALDRARQARKHAFAELCEIHPDLVWATYALNIGQAGLVVQDGAVVANTRWEDKVGKTWALSTLRDIAHKAYQYSFLSEKQAALVTRLVAELETAELEQSLRDEKRAAEKAARPNAAIGEIGERLDFTGTIVWCDDFVNDFDPNGGMYTIMIIATAEGTVKWKASKLIDVDRGDTVTFKATVKAHELYTPKGGTEADASITTVVQRLKFL